MTLREQIVSDFKSGRKFFHLCAFDPGTIRRSLLIEAAGSGDELDDRLRCTSAHFELLAA
jgi:hypothetical protein